MTRRTIIHADLDAFYASVEQLDNADLRGKPVVVGGAPEHRGVVAAASYEARAFGVRSAMPMVRALRLCPDAVRVSPRFDRYGELSRQVMGIFREVTPLVEPLSLDEAFLDVTAVAPSQDEAERLAAELKQHVREATQLTLSVGAGTNKTVAKIASDMRKPDGLMVVPFGSEREFLAPLPVRALWGVGPKTEAALVRAGMRTVGDIAARTEQDLERVVGSRAEFLLAMARGVDDRAIETEWERRSVGAETTFAQDLPDGPELRDELHHIAQEVARRMQRLDVRASTVALKLRYHWFKTISRQSSVKTPVSDAAQIEAIANVLLDKVVEEGDRFRLLGIQCSRLVDGEPRQSDLWHEPASAAGAETSGERGGATC
jgi:DNA polymerase-4